ncbi:Glutathione S-transferase-like protein ustS [Pseudocercospora fuligena]|uniref:Glutathione S-transferase-like protein ustS n=1 Tax=Pseudocercospora fuligena TaxID=685502 RepID=A0A8H6RJ55_9PEZI|nr:Glutathione S-transferase-like protein ustS [Pseudocercospora fuligena]
MPSDKITLYDLSSKSSKQCWSPNVWKTRLVLNYKNIPYDSEWLTHKTIEPTLSSYGIPPNDPPKQGPPQSAYTLPTIRLPDGTFIMDSAKIGPVLEEKYPENSLHLDTEMHLKAQAALGQVAPPLLGVLFPMIMRRMIPEDVVPTWRARREAGFGMTVEEFEAAKGGEKAWEAVKPGLENMSKFLKENKKDEGPFILGSQVCYGDFVIASLAEACKRIGKDDIYARLMRECPEAKILHEACGKWFERDS